MDWVIDTSEVYKDELLNDLDSDTHSSITSMTSASNVSSTNNCYRCVASINEMKECAKMIEKFTDTYFDASSIYEINISSSMKANMLKATEFVKDLKKFLEIVALDETCSVSVEEQTKIMHQHIDTLLPVLDGLKTELLKNMMDPFQRFLTSDSLYECVALFLSSQGDDGFHRQRILNANKSEGTIVLNQPDANSSQQHLAIINDTMKNLSVGHPIPRLQQLLEDVLDILNQSTDLYAISQSGSLGSMKDDTKNQVQIDLRYDDISLPGKDCWEKFVHSSYDLAHVDLTLLKTDEEKLTFFINAYNLLLLHALIISGSLPQVEVTNIIFYRKVKYNIGGYLFSLADIFNGILQCNQMKCLIFGKAFKKGDERRKFIPDRTFPEVYFGLINMTKYSPKLQVYQPTTLLDSLKQNTEDYFTRYVQILSSNQDPSEIVEIAIPTNLKEHKVELKNFWKGDSKTVLKAVSNLSTASSSISSSSLNPDMTETSSISAASGSESNIEAEKRKEVLNYLIENYHPEMFNTLTAETKKITKKTKLSYKPYQVNPPNWFTVFRSEFQKQIQDKFKVEVPASGEVLLAKQAKEKHCLIEAFFSKFSRTQKLVENASSTTTTLQSKESFCKRKRATTVWQNKSFKKKDISIIDFILGRKKDPTATPRQKKQACIIA